MDTMTVRESPAIEAALAILAQTTNLPDVHWLSGETPAEPFRANAKIRYRASEVPATVTPLPGSRVCVEFDTPQRAVTPGQAAVLYVGDEVIGGGTIERPT